MRSLTKRLQAPSMTLVAMRTTLRGTQVPKVPSHNGGRMFSPLISQQNLRWATLFLVSSQKNSTLMKY